MQVPTTLRSSHRLASILRHSTQSRLLSSTPPRFSSPEKPAAVTQNHAAPQAPPRRRGNKDQLPVLPIVAIFCLGSASFYVLVKTREGQGGKSHFDLPQKIPVEEDKFRKRPREY